MNVVAGVHTQCCRDSGPGTRAIELTVAATSTGLEAGLFALPFAMVG
jgi:hypothetical protein